MKRTFVMLAMGLGIIGCLPTRPDAPAISAKYSGTDGKSAITGSLEVKPGSAVVRVSEEAIDEKNPSATAKALEEELRIEAAAPIKSATGPVDSKGTTAQSTSVVPPPRRRGGW